MSVFYVGTSGWTYEHWKGDFYPSHLARSHWFEFYARSFRAVEVNATFYRAFADSTYHKWRTQAPPDFRYVLKAPRWITHEKLLVEVEAEIAAFWRSASLLEERLGGALLQVAPQTPYDLGRLRAALQAFPHPARVAVEFRAPSWERPEVRSLLRETSAALVSVDSPRSRLSEWVTGPLAYIRLHGRRRWYADDYSEDELKEIAALARRMADQGAQEVYVFFNNDVGGFAPHNAQMLRKMLA